MMVFLVMQDPDFVARWHQTVNEGDSAGRDVLGARAWEMFLERPLIGWGPDGFGYELEARFRGSRGEGNSSHNLELDTLMGSGILGSVPFFIGIVLCCRSAWKNRRRELGMLRLAVLVTVLVNAQFIPYGESKPLWLFLALCAFTIRPGGKQSNQRRSAQFAPSVRLAN
jgi:O-antigen ligase